MARLFEFENGHDSLLGLTKALIEDGERVAPRGHMTREIANAMIVINNPTDVDMRDMGRDVSTRLAVAEALQLIGGFSDPERLTRIAPNMKAFRNGGAFHGAYGPRLRPQLQTVVSRLTDDPLSRQAVMTIWDPLHDGQRGINDLPCTMALTYRLRDGKLHATTHMRSNDVWWGWTYDLFQFTQLQCTLASILNADVGTYTHVADSLHIYDRDIDKAKLLHPRRIEGPLWNGLSVTNVTRARSWAESLFYLRGIEPGHIYLNETEFRMVKAMSSV